MVGKATGMTVLSRKISELPLVVTKSTHHFVFVASVIVSSISYSSAAQLESGVRQ